MAAQKQTRWWRSLRAVAELSGDGSQQEIAETLHVSPAAVTGWKQGTPPRPENVVAAARAYGVDATELLQIAFLEDDDLPGKRKPKFPLSPRDDMPPY